MALSHTHIEKLTKKKQTPAKPDKNLKTDADPNLYSRIVHKKKPSQKAQYELACFYFNEATKPENFKKKEKILEKATKYLDLAVGKSKKNAEKYIHYDEGYADAQFLMGERIYFKREPWNQRYGSDFRKHKEEAYEWYEKAARQGHHQALEKMRNAYRSDDELGINSEKSFEWLRYSAAAGVKACYYPVASASYYGTYDFMEGHPPLKIKQNFDWSVRYFLKAAELPDLDVALRARAIIEIVWILNKEKQDAPYRDPWKANQDDALYREHASSVEFELGCLVNRSTLRNALEQNMHISVVNEAIDKLEIKLYGKRLTKKPNDLSQKKDTHSATPNAHPAPHPVLPSPLPAPAPSLQPAPNPMHLPKPVPIIVPPTVSTVPFGNSLQTPPTLTPLLAPKPQQPLPALSLNLGEEPAVQAHTPLSISEPLGATPIAATANLSIIALTPTQVDFMRLLQSLEMDPTSFQRLISMIEQSLLSVEELLNYQTWQKQVTEQISKIMSELSEAQLKLGLDEKTRLEQSYIENNEKLLTYQKRIEMEFNIFASCFFLAPGGILKLEDTKKDLMIAAITHLPKKIIAGIPLLGPLLNATVIEAGAGVLQSANRISYMTRINKVKELFRNLAEVSEISRTFARLLTLAKEKEIEDYNENVSQALEKRKKFHEKLNQLLKTLYEDKAISDKAGIKIGPLDKLAIIDCADLFQELFSKDPISTENLAQKLVALVTGKPYQPRECPMLLPGEALKPNPMKAVVPIAATAAAAAAIPVNPAIPTLPASPTSPGPAIPPNHRTLIAPVSGRDSPEVHFWEDDSDSDDAVPRLNPQQRKNGILAESLEDEQAWKKTQEAKQDAQAAMLRKQEEMLLDVTRREEAINEKLAILQKNLPKPSVASGGNQALAFAEERGNEGSEQTNDVLAQFKLELQALRTKLTLMEEMHEQQRDIIDNWQDKQKPKGGGLSRVLRFPKSKTPSISQTKTEVEDEKPGTVSAPVLPNFPDNQPKGKSRDLLESLM